MLGSAEILPCSTHRSASPTRQNRRVASALLLRAVGLLALLVGSGGVYRLLRSGHPLRVSSWPGLTSAGALNLLAHALVLGGYLALLGPMDADARERSALPSLPLVTFGTVLVLAHVARVTRMPGTASAVAGVYLLVRSVVSLLPNGVAPPPVLLLPALALDAVFWAWPHVSSGWPPLAFRRAILGGALAGLVLSIVEPEYEVIVGSPTDHWSGPLLLAGGAAAIVAGAVAALVPMLTHGRPERLAAPPVDSGANPAPRRSANP